MKKLSVVLLCSAGMAMGCGSVESTSISGASGSSGTGGAASAAASTGDGGHGGGILSTTASSGTGGGPPCAGAALFFDVMGDGPTQHFDTSCLPDGHLDCGGPGAAPHKPKTPPQPASGLLVLAACSQTSPLYLTDTAAMLPGSSTNVVGQYQSPLGGAAYSVPLDGSSTVTVTSFGDVGDVIEGSYAVNVQRSDADAGPATLALSGQFRVCRTPYTCAP